MGMFARFKKDPEGFRKLVELWETTPRDRRQRLIDVGTEEDPDYVAHILRHMLSFEDVLKMNDGELAEVLGHALPRTIAAAVFPLKPEVRDRFTRAARPKHVPEIRDHFESEIPLRETGGAQLKLVGHARECERKGLIRVKKIPLRPE